MEFRLATEADLDAVLSLVNRAYRETVKGSSRQIAFKSVDRYNRSGH